MLIASSCYQANSKTLLSQRRYNKSFLHSSPKNEGRLYREKYKGVEVNGGRYLASYALLGHGSNLSEFEIMFMAIRVEKDLCYLK